MEKTEPTRSPTSAVMMTNTMKLEVSAIVGNAITHNKRIPFSVFSNQILPPTRPARTPPRADMTIIESKSKDLVWSAMRKTLSI